MRTTTKFLGAGAAVAAIGLAGAYAFAQQGPGFGPGRMGMGPHAMGNAQMQQKMQLMGHDKREAMPHGGPGTMQPGTMQPQSAQPGGETGSARQN